jgi:hypothetical protein
MRSSRGFSVIWALALMAVVGGASAVTVTRLTALRGSTIADEADVRAVLAADGAIATARVALLARPAWSGGRLPVGGIPVTAEVVRSTNGWTVTGRAGGAVVLQADLVPDAPRPPRVVFWRRVH